MVGSGHPITYSTEQQEHNECIISYGNHHISFLQLYIIFVFTFSISYVSHVIGMWESWDLENHNRHTNPWLWWHSSQVLIYVTEIYGYVEIDTNSFLSNIQMWYLFLLIPSCPVTLSYVFKENFSWAITSLCYASCSSREQAELWFLKNSLVGD